MYLPGESYFQNLSEIRLSRFFTIEDETEERYLFDIYLFIYLM